MYVEIVFTGLCAARGPEEGRYGPFKAVWVSDNALDVILPDDHRIEHFAIMTSRLWKPPGTWVWNNMRIVPAAESPDHDAFSNEDEWQFLLASESHQGCPINLFYDNGADEPFFVISEDEERWPDAESFSHFEDANQRFAEYALAMRQDKTLPLRRTIDEASNLLYAGIAGLGGSALETAPQLEEAADVLRAAQEITFGRPLRGSRQPRPGSPHV